MPNLQGIWPKKVFEFALCTSTREVNMPVIGRDVWQSSSWVKQFCHVNCLYTLSIFNLFLAICVGNMIEISSCQVLMYSDYILFEGNWTSGLHNQPHEVVINQWVITLYLTQLFVVKCLTLQVVNSFCSVNLISARLYLNYYVLSKAVEA